MRLLIYRKIISHVLSIIAQLLISVTLGYVVSDRLIHIQTRVYSRSSKSGQRYYDHRICHAICRCELSETDIYNLYAAPVVSQNKMDPHMRPWIEYWEDLHSICRTGDGYSGQTLDLRLLRISREAGKEATRLFYSTNTFSFENDGRCHEWAPTLERWVAAIPHNLLFFVRHLHFKMSLEGHVSNSKTLTYVFDHTVLKRVPGIFPSLQSLNLVITLYRYVTCWRKSQNAVFMQKFLSLSQLKDFKVFTIWFHVDMPRHINFCQPICDEETHEKKARETYWQRREIRRIWAEEIRNLVLGKESE